MTGGRLEEVTVTEGCPQTGGGGDEEVQFDSLCRSFFSHDMFVLRKGLKGSVKGFCGDVSGGGVLGETFFQNQKSERLLFQCV